MPRFLLALGVLVLVAPAQLNLVRLTTFSHPVFGTNGTVGVAADSPSGNIVVVDFNQMLSVHAFTPGGTLFASLNATGCTPSLPSPNGITQSRNGYNFWLVDNSNGRQVLEMTSSGYCAGGWPFTHASNNPSSIAHHRPSDTLYIGSNGFVTQWTLGGTMIGTAIPVSFPAGNWIVAGLTFVEPTGNLLVAQNNATTICEMDLAGNVLSMTPLAAWGITNIQGLDFNPTTGHLLVVDNDNTRVHVFDYLPPGPPFSLSVTTTGAGDATVGITGLPPTCAEGFTLLSTTTTNPVGTGLTLGLEADLVTLLGVFAYPVAQAGNLFHWAPTNPALYPFNPSVVPAGTLSAFAGQTWDLVALALDLNGVGITASNVARITW